MAMTAHARGSVEWARLHRQWYATDEVTLLHSLIMDCYGALHTALAVYAEEPKLTELG